MAGLYEEGLLAKPKGYANAFPDLLTFHDAPTVIEQKLFVMFLKHRMRAFQGVFHMNPDYAFWYGWSAMQRDLTEIKEGRGRSCVRRLLRPSQATRKRRCDISLLRGGLVLSGRSLAGADRIGGVIRGGCAHVYDSGCTG